MAQTQTVFYEVGTGKILKVIPNRYIGSRQAVKNSCPEFGGVEIRHLYFAGEEPIITGEHKVMIWDAGARAMVIDALGAPLEYVSKGKAMREAIAENKTIIVDLEDGMGDKLYRANAVIEAQKKYKDHNFYCKCEFNYKPVLEMIPGIKLFTSYEEEKLDKNKCAIIQMPAKTLARNIGDKFPAPTRYGFYLNMQQTPYNIKIELPKGFGDNFENFRKNINWQNSGKNIVLHLRTKNFEGRSWAEKNINELTKLLRQHDQYNIYTIGDTRDMTTAAENIINLCGATSWLETIWMLKNSHLNYVIDSACLHLCKAIGTQYIALWGMTDPQDVIDRQPGGWDIGWSLTDRSGPDKKITPLEAFRKGVIKKTPKVDQGIEIMPDVSQHGEQKIIEDFFMANKPQNRIVVDVGAYGGEISNSLALLKAGWRGLLIEANPARIPIIKKAFSKTKYDLLNIAIGPETGNKTYYLHTEPGHNSFIPDWYPQTATGKTRKILMQKLGDILSENHIPEDVDLLTIDTEGMDAEIMAQLFQETAYRPRMIISEITSYDDAQKFYEANGYQVHKITGDSKWGNIIAVKKP